MSHQILIQTLVGQVLGGKDVIEWDRDEIKVDGQRVGFIPHSENAPLLMVRRLDAALLEEIRAAAREQRAAQNKPSVGDGLSQPPDPDKLPKGAKRKATP